MKTLRWAWQFLWARPLAAALNLLLLSLGLASITLVLLVNHQIQQAFARDLAGIDVVVGAKGSPLQLILSGVFQIDTPTGNVPLADVQALQANPQVAAQRGATLVVASHDARLLQYFTQAGPVSVLNLAASQIAGVAGAAA